MEFRRKTKALSGATAAVYMVFFIFLAAIYFSFTYFFKQEESSLAVNHPIKTAQELISEDSLAKPEIYIPDAVVIPIDTIKKEKITSEIKPKKELEEKEPAKNQKEEELAKSNSKKTDEKEKITTIGKDRALISFIPGTMGKPGKLPPHNCKTKGDLVMSFMVDKNGTVISAGRSSGINDKCTTTAAVIWLKQYVKAKKSGTSSKGSYTIKF